MLVMICSYNACWWYEDDDISDFVDLKFDDLEPEDGLCGQEQQTGGGRLCKIMIILLMQDYDGDDDIVDTIYHNEKDEMTSTKPEPPTVPVQISLPWCEKFDGIGDLSIDW